MTQEITPQQMKAIALAAHFAPMLKEIIRLATAAEAMLPQRQQYSQFIEDSKKLCFDFGTLCRAGDTEQIVERFRQTLMCCVAAQQDQRNVN